MRKCLKCEKDLPNVITINGKKHNICNRKFCLDCSPFKQHNTVNLVNSNRRPIYVYDGDEYKVCQLCKKEKNINEFYKNTKNSYHSNCRSCANTMTVERQRSIKQKAVDYLGNKCIVCSYDKCIGALEFHHINPEEKDFSISQVKLSSFERIKSELDKCVLLCANCHREFHGGLIEIPPKE